MHAKNRQCREGIGRGRGRVWKLGWVWRTMQERLERVKLVRGVLEGYGMIWKGVKEGLGQGNG